MDSANLFGAWTLVGGLAYRSMNRIDPKNWYWNRISLELKKCLVGSSAVEPRSIDVAERKDQRLAWTNRQNN